MTKQVQILSLIVAVTSSTMQASIVFSDNFESGTLDNWLIPGDGIIVADPAGGSGHALTFTSTGAGGSIWSHYISGGGYLSFDYFGRSGPGGAGGFIGISDYWLAGDVSYPGTLATMVNDNRWHHYEVQIPMGFEYGYIMAELWNGSAFSAGNGFFDNITVTTTHAPEPGTFLAGLGAVGMLGLFAWRNRK